MTRYSFKIYLIYNWSKTYSFTFKYIGFEWKVILVQIYHFSMESFHYYTDNSQSQIIIKYKSTRSQEKLNQLLEKAPVSYWLHKSTITLSNQNISNDNKNINLFFKFIFINCLRIILYKSRVYNGCCIIYF